MLDIAQTATLQTISAVQEQIIRETGSQIRDVSKTLMKDIRCEEDVTKDRVEAFIDDNFRILGHLRDVVSGLFATCPVPNRNNYQSVYSSLKCAYDLKIAHSKTIDELQETYKEVIVETTKTQCILKDTPVVAAAARRDQIDYTTRLNLWNLAAQ
jgi:hypothetical protein